MLSDAVNFGCLLITGLWMLLLAWWPEMTAAAALALLVVLGVAAKRHRPGVALAGAIGFVFTACGLSALCWLPNEVLLAALPLAVRPFAQLLVVPAPLAVMFLAVTLMQALLREPRLGL